jgi:hypothetical protein
MMVRTGPHLTEDKLERTLDRGLKKANCDIEGKPNIRAISPAVFQEIESLAGRTPSKTTEPPTPEGFFVRRLPVRDLAWEFHLKSPGQVLKKLTITYKNPEGSEINKEYQPSAPQDNGPLMLIVPGSYSLRVEPKHEPLAYEAEVLDLGEKPQTIRGRWPSSDRYYVITMVNFRGNRETLFHTLQDPQAVPNPLDSIRLGNDLVFVFANLEATGATLEGDLFAGNNLILGAPPPRNRRAARGWMLFPLTEGEMKGKLAELRKIRNEEQVVQEVRKNAVKVKENLEVSPSTPAHWVEITESGGGRYRREIPLKDFKGLLEKYPTVWGLLVWEFDDGSNPPAAINIKLPDGSDALVVEQEIKKWSSALQERIGQ